MTEKQFIIIENVAADVCVCVHYTSKRRKKSIVALLALFIYNYIYKLNYIK